LALSALNNVVKENAGVWAYITPGLVVKLSRGSHFEGEAEY